MNPSLTAPQPHVLHTQDGLHWVAGAVHAHTTMSDGRRTAHELVAHAHAKGLGVLCITDHHFDSWRYRFGLRVNRSSVQRLGSAPYLAGIADAAAAGIGPVVLPGIEVMPHYRWEGLPPFLCCQAMKTGVVYGLDDPAVLDAMPMRLDGRGRDEVEAATTAQTLIDYVAAQGGLFFWSHLEQDEQVRFATARIRYRPRPGLLATSRNYTGFGCFPHGHLLACDPGGAWDRRLAETLNQGRGDGPWALGECDYHWGDSSQPYEDIANPTTVFQLDALDPPAVMRALRRGRMYAYQGPDFAASLLRRWELRSTQTGVCAQSGDTLHCADTPRLTAEVSGFGAGCRMQVVVAGTVVAELDTHQLDLALPAPPPTGYACRLQVAAPGGERLMSNPIFVRPPSNLTPP